MIHRRKTYLSLMLIIISTGLLAQIENDSLRNEINAKIADAFGGPNSGSGKGQAEDAKYVSNIRLSAKKDITTPIYWTEKVILKTEISGTFSNGDNAPFWLTNNNYGIGSTDENSQYIRIGAFANKNLLRINNKSLRVEAGADIIVANNFQSDFYFHQLYLDLRYRSLGLSIGAKERKSEYLNDYLSSGGMSHSINARPIPQVEAGFPEYVSIPFTNDLLKIKGGLSYGWFTDTRFKEKYSSDGYYAKDVLYHRKYVYFKFDNNRAFDFILGLDMGAQFGGDIYREHEYIYSSPSGIKEFFKVLFPTSGGSNSSLTDQVNIIGNMYGSWHFVSNFRQPTYNIKAYYDHYFDDHSGMWFKNMPDGLYGIELSLKGKQPVTNILFEYIHTKDQTAPFLYDETPELPTQVSGSDNYYGSIDYISLSNYGLVFGNPLITSPIYNDNKTLWIQHNRISAFHGGLSGYIISDLQYKALFTYSRSWGTYARPTTSIKNQFSCILDLNYYPKQLKGWLLGGTLAYDSSSIVGDNFGFRIKIAKELSFGL